MYKCTECGCITKNKPDFCECGNNEFTVLEEAGTKSSFENPGRHFSDLNEKIGRNLPSIVIFTLCLILSLLSLVFLEFPQTENNSVSKNILQENKSVKKIEDIWVQSKGKTVVSNVKPQAAETKKTVAVLPAEIKKNPAPSTSKNLSVKKADKTSVNVKKAGSQKQNSTQTALKTNNKNTLSKGNINPVTSNKQAQAKNSSAKNTANTAATQKNTSAQTTTPPAVQNVPTVDYAVLNSYKISLRDVISSKIDFKSVAGDGSCKVSFRVNSSGYPVNKTFTVKSTNPLLNNAVVAAFNNLSTVPLPPDFYSGEKFTLGVYLKDGKYSVSLN